LYYNTSTVHSITSKGNHMRHLPSRRISIVALVTPLALGALVSFPALAGGLGAYELGTEDVGLAAAGYAARAQDATTVFTNPAGMTRLDGQQFQLGSQIIYTNLKFSNGGSTPALGTADGGYLLNGNGWFAGGGLFYSYSISKDLKIGIASSSTFGAALKYDDNWVGRYYAQQSILAGASILPSIAYRVNDQVSVGASVNAMFGYLKSVTGINNIAPGAADGKVQLRDTAWGWGGNVGVLYETSPGTRFGATYSSQVKLKFSAPAEFSGIAPGLNAVLTARGLLNAPVNINVNVPQQVMTSAFHTLNDRWAVLGNVGWQQWSKFGQVQFGIDSSNPTSLTAAVPLKDTWHGAVGAQYRPGGPWRYNFGVAYDSGFQDGNNIVSAALPVNSAWRFGVGAQNQVSKDFSWGVAGEYIYGGTININQQSAPPVAIGGRGNLVGSYNNVGTFYVSANANWKF
jgi:long-chain fatty acid transport protein